MPETRFGPYVLMKRIAVGGMAEVYLARYFDGPSDAHVVVKQILPQLAEEPELLQLFIDEARIASRVVHPGIVRVLDVGVEGGVHFLAMEYVDGLDVSQLMRLARELRGAFPVPQALRIAIDLCRGIHHAHEATEPDGSPLEIVHRDVSPQNVLISRTGNVKLTDFGIARARIRARRTATGVLRGKIAYVSPEQYLGDRGDRRVDVYAIGVVMFEMLAGRRPFTGDEAIVIREVMTKDSPSLLSVMPSMNPAVSQVIGRATARLPDQRIRTAAELADQLEDLGLACANEELGQLATQAIALRDRAKETSTPGKARATMTLSPAASPSEAAPRGKRTETLPVPLPDTLINPVAIDEDEGETVYATQPPVIAPTLTKHPLQLQRKWPVRAVLFSVISFGFIAGWIVSSLSPAEEEPAPILIGEVEISTATVASATIAEQALAQNDPEPDPEPDPDPEKPTPNPQPDPEPDPEPDPTLSALERLEQAIGESAKRTAKTKHAIPPHKKKPREKTVQIVESVQAQEPPRDVFGELNLDSDPWSRVHLGARDLGLTPLAHIKLPVGKHRLVLENPELHVTRVVILTIKQDDRTAVRVRLSDGQIVKR